MREADNRPLVAVSQSDGDTALENMLHHNGDVVFTVYKVSNGYNVLSHFNRRDRQHHIQDVRRDITFISSLEELAALMATHQAAYKITGV